MLSEFGKFCRKLRIERNELLLDMSQKLSVKPSFLSAVEMGKKSIPEQWEQKIIEMYNLNDSQILELHKAIEDSVRQIKFDLADRTIDDRNLLLTFARKLDNLDTEDKENIIKILNQRKGEE